MQADLRPCPEPADEAADTIASLPQPRRQPVLDLLPPGQQAKVRALLEGRYNVSFEDIRKVYLPALRHRVLLNFEAQAENIPADAVLAQILKEVKERPPEAAAARA